MHTLTRKKFGEGYWFTFLICIATATAIYLPFLIVDKGLFQYCGDFNSQQISFYMYMNDFVKQSAGQWSWETDLGSSAINSYSFYLLGSPFFWLSTLLPSAAMPFAMVPLLILKFGVSGVAAYAWLQRYAKTRSWAVVAACLYAFSGFTVYNTFFNHFLDCIALFPLLLWSLDLYMYDDIKGVFPVMVALNAVNNYFFFAGQIIFLFIYFFAKASCKDYKVKPKQFLLLAFESLLGVAMGCALLWPAVLSLADNPRTVNLSSGFGFLMYGKVQQYFAILTSLFLPPDPTYLPNIFTDCVIKHTSMTAYLPVVGIAGVVAYFYAHKKTPIRRMLITCLVMALVPVLNSAFYALNSSYYARWYYMPILIMCAATMHAFEDASVDLMKGWRPVAIITALYAIFALIPKEEDGEWKVGVVKEQSQFWLQYITAILGVALCLLLIRWFHKDRVRMATSMLAVVLSFSVVYSIIHISLGKFPQWEGDKEYRTQCYDGARNVDWPEGFYRIDTYECFDNLSVWTGKSGLQFFNSTVSPSIMSFYPNLGVKRDVSSKPALEQYALRGLLSVKYIMTPRDQMTDFVEKYSQYGFVYSHEDDVYAYYRNENWLPMGFAYTQYIKMENEEVVVEGEEEVVIETTQPTLMNVTENNRSMMLVRAIGLTAEQIEQYGYLLREVSETDAQNFSYDAYRQDVANRGAQSVSTFEGDGSGFTATITLQQENLVFFSVPYDEGFTATVNGVETPIENVSGGMCAVLCGAGDNTIVFHYETPGFAASSTVSLTACGIWLLYTGYFLYKRRKQKGIEKC